MQKVLLVGGLGGRTGGEINCKPKPVVSNDDLGSFHALQILLTTGAKAQPLKRFGPKGVGASCKVKRLSHRCQLEGWANIVANIREPASPQSLNSDCTLNNELLRHKAADAQRLAHVHSGRSEPMVTFHELNPVILRRRDATTNRRAM